MKIAFLLPVVIAFLSFSCTTKSKDPLPAGIMPADSLVKVLTDLQLVESAILLKQNEGKNAGVYASHYYAYVFSKYKLDSTRLKANFDFYQKNPDELEDLYKIVLDSLCRKQSESKLKP